MEALLSLTHRQKEAVYLKFYNGLTNDEISEVMQVNKQSVYNHISKAIQKMQGFVNV
jgi:RNA polymerase sigma factor (sigma-70 family)